MKKAGILLLAFILAFALSACAGKRPAQNGEPSSQTQAAVSSAAGSQPKENSADKNKASSQLNGVYSTLEDMKGTVGSLDDVDGEDLSIPTP